MYWLRFNRAFRLEAEIGMELSTENPEWFQERIFNAKLRAAELRQSSSPINEQLYYWPPENLDEFCGVFNRDVMERARLVDSSFQNNTVVVWSLPKANSLAVPAVQELHGFHLIRSPNDMKR
jgi:hypothetical protein